MLVTASWLTEALRRGGGDVTVSEVDVVRTVRTLTSDIAFLRVSGSGSGGGGDGWPTELFLKRARTDVDDEIRAGIARETLFYQRIAPRLPGDLTVRCFDASLDGDSGTGHLLLADLTATHESPPWPLPPSHEHAGAAVDYLAALHASWWRSPWLAELRAGDVHGDELTEADLPAAVGRGEAFLRMLRGRLRTIDHDRLAAALAVLPLRWQDRPRGAALLFGDAHFANFLFPREPSMRRHRLPVACDWQYWAVGTPGWDLAYLLALHWWPARRQAYERTLLERYHGALLAAGVELTWAELLLDYRYHVWQHLLVIPAWQWAAGVPAENWWIHVENGLATWDDLELDEFL